MIYYDYKNIILTIIADHVISLITVETKIIVNHVISLIIVQTKSTLQ